MHAILHSFTYPLKPLTQASISIQPIPILHATHNHVLPYPCVHPFNHTTKPVSLSKPSPTCGILPKKCHVALSPLHTQTVPLRRVTLAHSTRGRILSGRRSTFSGYLISGILFTDVPPSPNIPHPKFCPSTFHLLQISHIRNSVRLTFHLLRISHIRNFVRRRSTFSKYLTSEILSADIPPFPDISHSEFCLTDVPPSPDISHPKFCRPTFHLLRISHIQNSVRSTFHLLRISHIRSSVQPTFHLLRIFHIRRLTPDGREGRFNFPGQTCPDPLIALTRRASVADNSDSPDSLAPQTLAIRRIHFRPQSKGKLR